jgi:hypothetical protein
MGILRCVVVALNEGPRNIAAAALKSIGVQSTLLASLEDLPTTLEKIPACGILVEVNTSIKASPLGKQALRTMSEFYPCCKFKLVGNDVLLIGKKSLEA